MVCFHLNTLEVFKVMRRIHWFVLLVLLLSLPALACGGFGGGDEEATAVPEAAPAETEVEEAAPEATAVPEENDTETAVESTEEPAATEETSEEPAPSLDSALSFDTIDELPFNSYHITMVLEVTGTDANGEEVTQSLNSDFAISNDPQIMNIVMSFSGIDEMVDGETIEMAQVEGTSYMVVPEMGCITTSGSDILDENPFTDMMNPDQFLNNVDEPQYEGDETINGIETRHYSFDKFALTGANPDEIEDAEGHVYIAKDGGFLVRMVVDATGQVDLFDEGLIEDGQMHMEINLTDVDVPIEAAIPEACVAEDGTVGGVNSEFPMLEDASEVTSFAGILSYQTASSTEDALAFYDDALAAEGWTKDEAGSFVADDSALVSYTRDGVTLSLTLSANEEGGGSYVVLLSDEGE